VASVTKAFALEGVLRHLDMGYAVLFESFYALEHQPWNFQKEMISSAGAMYHSDPTAGNER
jgi:hypothetical protein